MGDSRLQGYITKLQTISANIDTIGTKVAQTRELEEQVERLRNEQTQSALDNETLKRKIAQLEDTIAQSKGETSDALQEANRQLNAVRSQFGGDCAADADLATCVADLLSQVAEQQQLFTQIDELETRVNALL